MLNGAMISGATSPAFLMTVKRKVIFNTYNLEDISDTRHANTLKFRRKFNSLFNKVS